MYAEPVAIHLRHERIPNINRLYLILANDLIMNIGIKFAKPPCYTSRALCYLL